jgi:hypothetical protein
LFERLVASVGMFHSKIHTRIGMIT